MGWCDVSPILSCFDLDAIASNILPLGHSASHLIPGLISIYYIAKHLGCFNHILGSLSCISVTKECYQIGFH